MGRCEFIETCPYLNDVLVSMRTAAALVKQRYCTGKPSQCALRTIQQSSEGKPTPARPVLDSFDFAQELIESFL